MADSAAEEFEQQVAQLPPDVRNDARALITLGRAVAQRFDAGYNPAASQLRLVLADLRKLTDRWERLTMPSPPPAATPEPERSALDELRERRDRKMGETPR
jgi:hypothetical protein